MATKSIDVELLAKMFLAGAQNIEAKKEYINELNVFPVPVVQEVTQVLFFLSCFVDSQNPSRRKVKLMYLHLQEQLYVQKRQHIRLL